jgi:hypothetical protein
MGFFDNSAAGGRPPFMRWNGNEAKFLTRDGDTAFNNEVFVLDTTGIVAGYIKFAGKGEQPERRTGAIFPKDEAPDRASLGDTDVSKWPKGRFSGEAEDPWVAMIELPLKHQETGEEYILSLQTKASIGAARDLLAQLRRLPNGHNPIIRLGTGTMKTKFGDRKKPVLSIIGKVPHTNGATDKPFDDPLCF